MSAYWRLSRSPRYSLLFALPLLLLYEALAFVLSHDSLTGVRNGADVLLKSVFVWLGGRIGLIVFGLFLLGGGAVLIRRDRSGGKLRPQLFLLMAIEAGVYAGLFGIVTGILTGWLLGGLRLAIAPAVALDLPTQLMVSLGAGIYEELLFRVLIVGALAWLAKRLFGWGPVAAGLFATMTGALIFSLFHYVGPYGDELRLGSFAFRAVAGVLFSGLYLTRGFGITAWTHALYDVLVTI
ncbi:MAG TPA: CPBP family glutamic-type intramembrane protease [Gemmatimonadales bacterium]|nr:CPBP family glutamic-type intramembrane protease [Gemmatimonadales bacterium]